MYRSLKVVLFMFFLLGSLVAKGEVSQLTDKELSEIQGNCPGYCYWWETDYCVRGDLYSEACATSGVTCLEPGAKCDETVVEGPDHDCVLGPYGYPGQMAYTTTTHCSMVAVYVCVQNAFSCDCELSHTEARGTRYICTGDMCD